jgi:AAA family ATP:ADP antiporter
VSVLSRFFRIQPGEGRTVALVVALMFLSVGGLTIGESGISALFFDRIGPDSLPVMYVAGGAVGIAAMLALSAALGRFERRRAYVALPLLVAGVVAVERAVVTADPAWIYPVLWLTTTVAYLVEAVYLWGTAGLVTDTRRAKRLFPLFGAGGILGAVVGGVATRPLASTIGAPNLLVVWAVALVGASALGAAVLGVRGARPRRHLRSRRPSAVAELEQGFAFVRGSSLLVWMSVAAVLASVLFYSLYLPYAQAATGRFPDPDELAGFFGIFWAVVTAAAFLVSVLLTNRLLGWFGAAAMVLVLPFLYAGAFGVLLVISTFEVLVAIRFAVNVWLQGVSHPAWETLVNVTPEHRRDQTRAFLNGGPTQLGTVIAGVVQRIGRGVLVLQPHLAAEGGAGR